MVILANHKVYKVQVVQNKIKGLLKIRICGFNDFEDPYSLIEYDFF